MQPGSRPGVDVSVNHMIVLSPFVGSPRGAFSGQQCRCFPVTKHGLARLSYHRSWGEGFGSEECLWLPMAGQKCHAWRGKRSTVSTMIWTACSCFGQSV